MDPWIEKDLVPFTKNKAHHFAGMLQLNHEEKYFFRNIDSDKDLLEKVSAYHEQ